jgi:hypothetical protein
VRARLTRSEKSFNKTFEQNDEIIIFDLKEVIKKKEADIDGLKRQVHGEYNQVGKHNFYFYLIY